MSRGTLNYRTNLPCGRRSFGRRACGRQGSPWQSSYSRFDSPNKAHAPMPPSLLSPRRTRVSGPNSSSNVNVNPARPPHEPVRASLASGTTATTAQSSLLATGLGGCDRISATFGMFRTATTVTTSVAASDLYRGDSSSMAPSVSESSYWDNESSAGSQHHHTVSCHRICVIGSRVRLGTVI